jgi:predicted DNA-binding transcriptional regulator AlpA
MKTKQYSVSHHWSDGEAVHNTIELPDPAKPTRKTKKAAFKAAPAKRTRTETQIAINLDRPGRVRVAHVLALLGISRATLYRRQQDGKYPKFDGIDGTMPYYRTETVKALINRQSNPPAES